MIIGHYAASITIHYHASNMTAVFSGSMLREPHTVSLSHPDIYKILSIMAYMLGPGMGLGLKSAICTIFTIFITPTTIVSLCQLTNLKQRPNTNASYDTHIFNHTKVSCQSTGSVLYISTALPGCLHHTHNIITFFLYFSFLLAGNRLKCLWRHINVIISTHEKKLYYTPKSILHHHHHHQEVPTYTQTRITWPLFVDSK